MIAMAGGYFAWLVLAHFLFDWVPQSHLEAIKKSSDWKIRAEHCAIYVWWFLLVLIPLLGLCWKLPLALAILFISHFVIDTYCFTLLWMKYVRKHPAFVAMTDMKFRWKIDEDDKKAFRTAIQEPLGMILMVVIDQLQHFLFLIPIVWMIMQ
jgi:Protein of unknown function (DUF3307)